MKSKAKNMAPTGANEITRRAFRQGFYWPITVADAQKLVRNCQNCQMSALHFPLANEPVKSNLTNVAIRPLQRWGIDLDGPNYIRQPLFFFNTAKSTSILCKTLMDAYNDLTLKYK
jgi:hypothetical protein